MINFLVLIKDHFFSSFRSKKSIVFLVLYLAIFGLIAYGFFQLQNMLNSELDRQGISSQQRSLVMAFGRSAIIQNDNKPEIVNLLLNVPFINIALFLVALFGTPLLILLLSYDKISQEVYDGTIRFLLFRTSRLKIYLAKFISGVIEVAAITFIALFLALLWGSFQIKFFDFGVSLTYGLRFWLIAQPFLWIFIAFSLLFSSIFRKPFHALLFSFIGFFVLSLIPIWIHYISPFDAFYLEGLFFDFSPELFRSLGIFSLFTIIFLFGGYLIFNKNDL